MKFDSLPVLHRHIQRFCDVRQKNETWWKKVEEEDSDEHLSQVSLVKVTSKTNDISRFSNHVYNVRVR